MLNTDFYNDESDINFNSNLNEIYDDSFSVEMSSVYPGSYDFEEEIPETIEETLDRLTRKINITINKDLFVNTFVKKWPRLASQVSLNIEAILQDSLLSHIYYRHPYQLYNNHQFLKYLFLIAQIPHIMSLILSLMMGLFFLYDYWRLLFHLDLDHIINNDLL